MGARRYAEALRHYERSLGLARDLRHRGYEGLDANSLGVTLSRLSRHEEARTVLEESIRRESRDRRASARGARARGARGRGTASGRFEAAADISRRRVAVRHEIGDRGGEELDAATAGRRASTQQRRARRRCADTLREPGSSDRCHATSLNARFPGSRAKSSMRPGAVRWRCWRT